MRHKAIQFNKLRLALLLSGASTMAMTREKQEGGDEYRSSGAEHRPTGISSVRFHPGNLKVSRGAMNALTPEDRANGMARHLNGDWGEVSEERWRANEDALKQGLPLLSSYQDRQGTRFSIFTDRDRSWTTVLLPAEF